MKNEAHNTAIVIIPPADAWGPIQAIRQKHDIEELQADWAPIRFPVLAVHLISRGSRPDDAFRIVKSLPLQGVPSVS